MRKESAGVTEALLKSAQLEFLTHGFHDASLRRQRSKHKLHLYEIRR